MCVSKEMCIRDRFQILWSIPPNLDLVAFRKLNGRAYRTIFIQELISNTVELAGCILCDVERHIRRERRAGNSLIFTDFFTPNCTFTVKSDTQIFIIPLDDRDVYKRQGCALCGLAVGIMWPGSISISSQKCPRGGTAMFAFLALAGDLCAMVSPAMVGTLSEMADGNLKTGLLVATIFPVILVFGLLILNKKISKIISRTQ